MDDICVIDCTKIDGIKFKSFPSKTSNNNSFNNSITNPILSDSLLFYDKVTRKIIQANAEGLKVYNKKFTKLLKEIKIETKPEKLISVIVDKKINYILFREILDDSINKKKTQSTLILLNTTKNTRFNLFGEYDFLLGMFFINELDFCLVFTDKIIFYEIIINSDKLEKICCLYTVKISSKKLIKNFSFNSIKNILFITYTENSAALYDLNNKKSYNHKYKLKIPDYILNKNKIVPAIGSFKTASNEIKKQIVNFYESKDKYTESQFYLECLYEQLYLIYLSYENHKISIFEIENFQDLKLVKDINYYRNIRFSGLQIKDNLIIVHNFELFLVWVIDIKSHQMLINVGKNVQFPYQKNLIINGEMLEERRDMNKNNIILEGGNMYNIIFNTEKYENLFEKAILKTKKELKLYKTLKKVKNEHVLKYYDMLFNILNRKNTKNYLMKILHNMILQNNKCMDIIPFLYKIIERIKIKNKIEITKNNNNENISRADIIVYNCIIKNFITQSDIYFSLFNEFHNDISKITIKKSLNAKQNIDNNILDEELDNLLYKIFFYLIIFINKIINENIILDKSYSSILVDFLYLMKNHTKIISLLQNKDVVNNKEIGTYLLAISQKKDIKYGKVFEQMGLNILTRLRKYDLILDYYFKNKSICETFSYLKNHKKHLSYERMVNLLYENKNFFNKNKTILVKYLKT